MVLQENVNNVGLFQCQQYLIHNPFSFEKMNRLWFAVYICACTCVYIPEIEYFQAVWDLRRLLKGRPLINQARLISLRTQRNFQSLGMSYSQDFVSELTSKKKSHLYTQKLSFT